MSSRTLAIRERIASAEREISQSLEIDTQEKYDRLIMDYHKCMDMYENVIEVNKLLQILVIFFFFCDSKTEKTIFG